MEFLSAAESGVFVLVGPIGGVTQAMIGAGETLVAVPALMIAALHFGLPAPVHAPAIASKKNSVLI